MILDRSRQQSDSIRLGRNADVIAPLSLEPGRELHCQDRAARAGPGLKTVT